ncbi:glycosyl transferase group 1 [Solidesulfovibrio carbinoliphilus subsp. oakridgensis]|uniref:Glycosyl transferase group 1 n=1 Tax=Solidesulfovibrio carbinoliphilus subsp. oakridgensis TaxID=694327 RepID=G7Q4C1_9BACT|nr:glycosyltransferase family 1 protein [Solidesulfovibrio carbinoliphilus]EHJ46989.1 glycosyl transferase group 1 [Solidesulfovibrio carbinoliphilus subsp. oakridgensis]
MRIAVSARTLDYPSGGPKEYLIGLVNALLTIGGHELVLYYSRADHLGTFPGATENVLPVRNRLLFDWLALPLALRRARPDVAFFPSSNMPPGIPCPAVVAMLDLGYFHPTLRMYKTADTCYMRRAIRYSARRAERIVAISEHTRRDVLRLTRARPENVSVTPLSCDPIYKRPVSPDAVASFRRDHRLSRDFILYAGNISPRKNLSVLLAAFAKVRGALDCDLAVTGGLAWNQDFEADVARLGLAGRVRRLGHIARDDMPLLYRAASALAFPSRFEGFGLPVLEAQACGTPVVCADATSLPEAAGKGALLVDPTDTEAWAAALARVTTDTALRRTLIAAGRANEAHFTWEKTARLTLAALEAAAGAPGR